jgi:hypothetical protein
MTGARQNLYRPGNSVIPCIFPVPKHGSENAILSSQLFEVMYGRPSVGFTLQIHA